MEFAFSSSAVNNALVADWRTDTHFVSQQSSVLRQTDVEITLLRPPTELGPVRICVRVIGRLSEPGGRRFVPPSPIVTKPFE